MPLTAIMDGQRIVAPLLTEAEWEHVRDVADSGDHSRLVIGYSGLPCYPRTSRAGLKHFVHRSGHLPDIEFHTETPQHLRLKTLVVQAATDAGWSAATEVPSDDRSWVADTILTKGSVRIAVEIQWSSQTLDTYRYRQQRYAEAGIRCAWIYRHQSISEEPHTDDLPVFQVDPDTVNYDPEILLEGIVDGVEVDRVPLNRFIDALLNGQVQRCIRTQILPDSCYQCGALHTIWLTELSPMFQLDDRMEFSPGVVSAVESVIGATDLPVKAHHKVVTTKASSATYDAFTCPQCGSAQGDYFVHQEFSVSRGRSPHLVLSPSKMSFAQHGRWMVSSPVHSFLQLNRPDTNAESIITEDAIDKMVGWDRY